MSTAVDTGWKSATWVPTALSSGSTPVLASGCSCSSVTGRMLLVSEVPSALVTAGPALSVTACTAVTPCSGISATGGSWGRAWAEPAPAPSAAPSAVTVRPARSRARRSGLRA